MRISSAHVHTTFCDGSNTVQEMIESAIENGFKSVGISSHGVQNFDLPYCMSSFNVEREYIKEVKRLAKQYEKKIKVWLGVERDCYSISDSSNYEYFIASQHYILFDDMWLPVNATRDQVDIVLERYCAGSIYQILEKYFDEFSRYIIDKKPNIIGHFDIVKRLNDDYSYFSINDKEYIRLAKKAMKNIINYCDLMEVNTCMIEKRGVEFMYPCPLLLKYWQKLGGKIIINSDCHYKERITSGYKQAIEEIKKANFNKMCVLGTDNLFDIIDLER